MTLRSIFIYSKPGENGQTEPHETLSAKEAIVARRGGARVSVAAVTTESAEKTKEAHRKGLPLPHKEETEE
jgi:hypothetical protein